MSRARRHLPAGRPPHPRGHGVRAVRRGAGLRRGVAGREPAGARGHRADGGVRRRSPTRIKVGSGVVDCWSRNPARLAATFSTLDDLAPGRVILGIGAWWDPLAAKVGISRGQAARRRCARSSPWCGRCCTTRPSPSTASYVHLDGVELDYVYQERRPKDVPDLHRGHGHADDGAHRRDRRRRGAQLPRLARLQRAGDGAPGHRRRARPAARSTTSTGPSWWCARCTRTARPPSTWPA